MNTIGIDRVDVSDGTYCISYPLEDDLLASSIARFGILVPLGIIDREPPVVVTGFKRIEAARRLGIATIPYVFLDVDDRQALLTSISDNLKRPLNTIEKARCVERMEAHGFPKEDIYEVARLIGLPARVETLRTALAMHSMEESVRALVAKHNLPLPVVEQLLWFDAQELAFIVRLVDSFRSTTSLFREVLHLLALLKTKRGYVDFQELGSRKDMEALRQSLKRATHPLLSHLEDRLEKIREASALPPHIRVQVDPVFEKEAIDIHVRARNVAEVDEALKKLEALSRQGVFRSIFELTHGAPERETRGSIVRDCPGTRHHVCCGYKTIDLIEGCPLGCSYCILKGYLNSPGITVHRDIDGIIEQIERAVASENEHVLRFGTGELSDSLALDRRLRLNEPIVQFFGEAKGPLLELKSKWASIDHLKSCLNPYTIISFSLSPQGLVDVEEKRTSPIRKRLKALRAAQDLGCFVGLHFDPVIIYDGFEQDYRYLIDDIARLIDLKRVIWVSLGLLRFVPSLMKAFMREGRRTLLNGEFIMGEDGKYRYLKAERIKVYRMLYAQLLEKEPGLFVYLCMERADVWQQVTGRPEVRQSADLVRLFDSRIREFYGG